MLPLAFPLVFGGPDEALTASPWPSVTGSRSCPGPRRAGHLGPRCLQAALPALPPCPLLAALLWPQCLPLLSTACVRLHFAFPCSCCHKFPHTRCCQCAQLGGDTGGAVILPPPPRPNPRLTKCPVRRHQRHLPSPPQPAALLPLPPHSVSPVQGPPPCPPCARCPEKHPVHPRHPGAYQGDSGAPRQGGVGTGSVSSWGWWAGRRLGKPGGRRRRSGRALCAQQRGWRRSASRFYVPGNRRQVSREAGERALAQDGHLEPRPADPQGRLCPSTASQAGLSREGWAG